MPKRKKEELEEILKEQLHLLSKSIKDYDNGDNLEAIRIAGHLRTLLYDNGTKSICLLTHLEMKDSLELFDSKLEDIYELTGVSVKSPEVRKSPFLLPNIIVRKTAKIDFYAGLLRKEIIGENDDFTFKYVPLLDNHLSKKVNFADWWSAIIFDDHINNKLSREDVVKMIANKDGYSHVDDNPPEKYLTFKNSNIIHLEINGKISSPNNIPIFPAVRQIAFEFISSISAKYPEYLS